MTTVQLKKEIQKILDQLPDEVLPDVLGFLTALKSVPSEKIRLAKFIKQTLKEDKELLQKLAD